MAPKGEDQTKASSATLKKVHKTAISSQETVDELEDALDGDGGPPTVTPESRKHPLELVGNRIGLLHLDFIGPCTRDIIDSFFDLTRDAEEHRIQEYEAAIHIQVHKVAITRVLCNWRRWNEKLFLYPEGQSAWRRKATWLRLKRLHAHATRIQSRYRGHLHRVYAKEVRRRVDKFLRLIYFGKHAVRIQRHFRGYYSRKYKHDFYQRKAYIARVVDIGTEIRKDLRKSYLEQMEREQEEANKKVQGEIDNFIESSHCRVGTESCKGAFYSPLIAIFGKGRSYLEEHIKDARRRQVTGMELWKKAGFDEYGIPIKVANNKFFVKQSRQPHSKMSIDSRRRVEDAALITSMLGTYITSQNCGPYITKRDLIRKADKEKDLYNPHEKEFDTCPYVRVDYQHLEHPTVRQGSEFGQRERLRKEEKKRLEAEFPNMVENPFMLHHPSGKVFDLPTVVYGKIFPKRHHHTHFPRDYSDRDRRLNSMPAADHGSLEKVRFQSLLTEKRLSSMNINRRHSRRDSHVM